MKIGNGKAILGKNKISPMLSKFTNVETLQYIFKVRSPW